MVWCSVHYGEHYAELRWLQKAMIVADTSDKPWEELKASAVRGAALLGQMAQITQDDRTGAETAAIVKAHVNAAWEGMSIAIRTAAEGALQPADQLEVKKTEAVAAQMVVVAEVEWGMLCSKLHSAHSGSFTGASLMPVLMLCLCCTN